MCCNGAMHWRRIVFIKCGVSSSYILCVVSLWEVFQGVLAADFAFVGGYRGGMVSSSGKDNVGGGAFWAVLSLAFLATIALIAFIAAMAFIAFIGRIGQIGLINLIGLGWL